MHHSIIIFKLNIEVALLIKMLYFNILDSINYLKVHGHGKA